MTGFIEVDTDGVLIVKQDGPYVTSGGRPGRVYMEDLIVAAEQLGRWMRLPYRDRAKECRRLSRTEQKDAFVRDTLIKDHCLCVICHADEREVGSDICAGCCCDIEDLNGASEE